MTHMLLFEENFVLYFPQHGTMFEEVVLGTKLWLKSYKKSVW